MQYFLLLQDLCIRQPRISEKNMNLLSVMQVLIISEAEIRLGGVKRRRAFSLSPSLF